MKVVEDVPYGIEGDITDVRGFLGRVTDRGSSVSHQTPNTLTKSLNILL